jgi:TRAP-type C4-dicarboxylate transport system permease small subunit
MRRIERILADVFGAVFLFLALFVAAEAIARKLFNISLQGANELGGYTLAIGASIGFTLALRGRDHIRVDVLHRFLPPGLQALLNWLSITTLAALAVLLVVIGLSVLKDTIAYRSSAPTPWATPLVWPQSVWYAGMLVFAASAVAFAARATLLLLTARTATLNEEFQPKGAKDELEEELADIAQRGTLNSGAVS